MEKLYCLSESGTGSSFPVNWRCDGIAECDDVSDEMNCAECKPHQFRCQNGDCIDAKYRCDVTPHCKDESDEQCCQKNLFLCSSYECICRSQLCDSKTGDDCSDENSGNCAVVTSHQLANLSPNHTYIAIFGIVIDAFYETGCCRLLCRKKLPSKDEDIHDVMLPSSMSAIDHFRTVSCGPQRDISVSSFQGSSRLIGLTDSMPASGSSMYDRNHVTPASSSSSSRTYPLETVGPPPSPVSVRSPQIRSSCKRYRYIFNCNRNYLQSSYSNFLVQIHRISNVYKSCSLDNTEIVKRSESSVSFAEMLKALGDFKDEDIHDVMFPSSRSGIDNFSTVSSGPRRDIAVSSFQGSSRLIGLTDSMPASGSSMYVRNHVTPASSSSSSRTYPLDTVGPPPSPVSIHSPQFGVHTNITDIGINPIRHHPHHAVQMFVMTVSYLIIAAQE